MDDGRGGDNLTSMARRAEIEGGREGGRGATYLDRHAGRQGEAQGLAAVASQGDVNGVIWRGGREGERVRGGRSDQHIETDGTRE